MNKLLNYTFAEEVANVITHGLAFLASLLVFFYFIDIIPLEYSYGQKTAIIIYSLTLMLMFLSSTLYHAANNPSVKQFLKRLDHCSIYLLIAGTYTPLLTIFIPGTMSIIILVAVWLMAVIGIFFKIFFIGRFKKISITTYLLMGWLGVLLINKINKVLDPAGLYLILAGGIAYSVGVVFYINKHIPFNHAIWHCFVIMGAFIHCWFIAENVLLVI
ncbi:MAG: hemolysin III family protein [Hellea sp.]|nr:hemolysin III family protein [Hellea sp.]MDG2361917.1 hemolysin III family protein [Hellea sp.]